MFLQEEKEKVIQYLIDNKQFLKDQLLKDITAERDKLLKEFDSSLHDDIEIQYIQIVRMMIAEDIAKNTGISTDNILYLLEYMGVEKFKEYLT